MADQISSGMGNLSLESKPAQNQAPAQQQQPVTRSYIPPHLRNKMAQANKASVNSSGPGPQGGVGGGAPMNGLNNSAWARYVLLSSI